MEDKPARKSFTDKEDGANPNEQHEEEEEVNVKDDEDEQSDARQAANGATFDIKVTNLKKDSSLSQEQQPVYFDYSVLDELFGFLD